MGDYSIVLEGNWRTNGYSTSYGRILSKGGAYELNFSASDIRLTNGVAARDFTGWGESILRQNKKLVATYDGSYVKLYIDGVPVGSLAQGNPPVEQIGSDLYILNRAAADRTMDGSLSQARIYNRALTTEEVENLYLTNTTPYDNDSSICVLNLEATSGNLSGSTWVDQSGNGNNGTLTGATLSAEAPTTGR